MCKIRTHSVLLNYKNRNYLFPFLKTHIVSTYSDPSRQSARSNAADLPVPCGSGGAKGFRKDAGGAPVKASATPYRTLEARWRDRWRRAQWQIKTVA